MITASDKFANSYAIGPYGFYVGGLGISYYQSKFDSSAYLLRREWSGIEQDKNGYPIYQEGGENDGYLIAGGDESADFEPQTIQFYGFTIWKFKSF